MSVTIQLDRQHPHFTNLDFIVGRVVLSIFNNETISAIVVKLEGESSTHVHVAQLPQQEQLARAFNSRGRRQAELEVHKLLYKVVTVFPDENLKRTASENSSFTLPPGVYEYPFKFKIPFNNDCVKNSLSANTNNVVGLLGEINRPATRHVRKALPPSLNGLPGQAEIRYYVKVTVQRPAFYKENFRALAGFVFIPIEPPRGPENRRESFARREHQFAPKIEVPSKPGLFNLKSPAPSTPEVPPSIRLDGRLPDPAIISCSEPLPLRILIGKLNESPSTIYLQLLHIELVGHTHIRASELQIPHAMSWVILSASNMKMPLGSRDGSDKDVEIDRKLWSQIPLPKTVAPSFDTCNITRSYSLDIKVGLSYGSSNKIYPELTVQSLHMPVKVYSGITPPPELLARMSDQWPVQSPTQPLTPQPFPNQGLPQPFPNQGLPRPQSFPSATSSSSRPPPQTPRPQPPPQSPSFGPTPSQNPPEDAPPSYEDAIADGIGPVDGPRRDYGQQLAQSSMAGKGGRDERLFTE